VALAAISLFASRAVIEPLIPEILERQRQVLESGRYILGPELEAFEAEFAAYLGVRHCVGVANGTDALTIALRSLGIGRGDEVIVPSLTFFATAEAVINAGATPVFADIDADTHCMTAATAEPLFGSATKALLPVHLFGNVAPMAELRELAGSRRAVVVEDAAQAAGARLDGRRAGSLGAAACFSFYPGKNLGAFGDAGAIATDDADVAARARMLRHHGTAETWVHADVGYNSRLDELQAAGLRVALRHLDEWITARRRVAALYADSGIDEHLELPVETAGAKHAYHLYVGLSPRRDELIEGLAQAGIEARAYYTTPMHRQPSLAALAGSGGALPNAERLAAEGIALPMGPALSEESVAQVAAAVRDAAT
jgi:dTDP-4-amino-4,6-dideoxygalactose transaminase